MNSRYDLDYVSIELLRAVVAIVDSGSFTKAGALLGLTQSAISAQVKRLQQRVGGDVFAKSGGGLTLTERGRTIDRYARRILDMNAQLVLLSGAHSASRLIRLGLPVSFARFMLPDALKACAALGNVQVQLQCAMSNVLLKQLDNGYLDVALLVSAPSSAEMTVTWEEPLVWVRSPDLNVSPGAPIPYVSWPDSNTDRIALGALERAGLSYVVSFAGADYNARLAAAQAALGYMLLPARAVFGAVQPAREYFLPPIPPTRGGLCLRPGFDAVAAEPLLYALESIARPLVEDRHDAAPTPRSSRSTPRVSHANGQRQSHH
ncbi:MAG: LysR family transcriptional regulator [Rhizobiales bacterium]|jgi:DNA-binding transcriptional LysR family regulator|nr:LysR family transcriptional regulator [Hyphomicrobiales bacterium]